LYGIDIHRYQVQADLLAPNATYYQTIEGFANMTIARKGNEKDPKLCKLIIHQCRASHLFEQV
jgi:hypothetical protein